MHVELLIKKKVQDLTVRLSLSLSLSLSPNLGTKNTGRAKTGRKTGIDPMNGAVEWIAYSVIRTCYFCLGM
jgi:hypothetical protein